MINRIYQSLCVAVCALGIMACTNEDYKLYDVAQKDAVFFEYIDDKEEIVDSVDYVFDYNIAETHTIEVPVRLMGMPVDEVEMNRFEVSMAASQELGATVVLKGPYTIVTGANGLQYINNTGNPGMATGGSGDVLAGMISAFAARGISEEEAAAAAVYLHGLAGDFAKETTGEESLTPTDIVENISKAIQKCM